jgi:hypothetical protein
MELDKIYPNCNYPISIIDEYFIKPSNEFYNGNYDAINDICSYINLIKLKNKELELNSCPLIY